MEKLKNFKLKEFDCPTLQGSGAKMDSDFLKKLDRAREYAGIPFVITSGYRTKYHNSVLKKSKKDSSHLKGLAVDISVNDSRSRYLILEALIKEGFTRIGLGNTFIHVDDDYSKDINVIWLYNG